MGKNAGDGQSWIRGLTAIAVLVAATGVSVDSATARPPSPAPAPSRPLPSYGLIVVSDVFLRPTPYDSAATMVKAIGRVQEQHPINACCSGAWRLHFAAHFNQPLEQATLDLEFRDISNPRPLDKPVFAAVIPARVGETTVFVNDFVVSKEQGFAPAHTYEVWLVGGLRAARSTLAKGTFMMQ